MSRRSTRQSVSEFLRNHYVDPTPIDPDHRMLGPTFTINGYVGFNGGYGLLWGMPAPRQIRTTNQMVREFERVCGPTPTEPVKS